MLPVLKGLGFGLRRYRHKRVSDALCPTPPAQLTLSPLATKLTRANSCESCPGTVIKEEEYRMTLSLQTCNVTLEYSEPIYKLSDL